MKKAKGTTEAVTRAIAADIQTGLLPAGTWLKQIDLQHRYGASRPEIRRALDALVVRRFVQHEQHRGYYVYRLDDRRQGEYREIRVIIETATARGIIAGATGQLIDELLVLAREFERSVEVETLLAQHEANSNFHRRLYASCGNAELSTLISEYRSRGPAAPLTQWKSFERLRKSAAEHFDMIEAIRAGDAERLSGLIRQHIIQKV